MVNALRLSVWFDQTAAMHCLMCRACVYYTSVPVRLCQILGGTYKKEKATKTAHKSVVAACNKRVRDAQSILDDVKGINVEITRQQERLVVEEEKLRVRATEELHADLELQNKTAEERRVLRTMDEQVRLLDEEAGWGELRLTEDQVHQPERASSPRTSPLARIQSAVRYLWRNALSRETREMFPDLNDE